MGIDPGTTNSLIAVWEQGAARERMQTHPHLSTAAIKRHMGSDKEVTPGKRAFRAEVGSDPAFAEGRCRGGPGPESGTGRIMKVPHRRPFHAAPARPRAPEENAAAPPDTQK